MSHTPGPWVRRDIASKDMYVGPANDGGAPNVAIIPKRITRTDDEQLANARLIAVAPELLEAVQRYLADRAEAGCTADSAAVKAMRHAVAKVAGETK